jgi:hypothetical protein
MSEIAAPLSEEGFGGLDALELSHEPFLEKNLEFMSEATDELREELSKYQYFTKNMRRSEAALASGLAKRVGFFFLRFSGLW